MSNSKFIWWLLFRLENLKYEYSIWWISNYSLIKGRFFGIKTTSPSSKFQMSFETTYPISLNSGWFYNLQFNIFYNCYQTKSVLDFFKSDCSDVVDRLTIYYKPTPNDLYSPLRQFNLTKRDNSDNWRQFNLDIYSITNILSVWTYISYYT